MTKSSPDFPWEFTVNTRLTLTALGIAASFVLHANAQFNPGDIFVQPETQRVNDTVRIVTAPTSACDQFGLNTSALTMVMANNRIIVTIPSRSGACGTPSPLNTIHGSLGQFPPGSYEVEVVLMQEGQGGRLVSVGTRSFSVQPRVQSAPLTNSTDIWWDPSESGWGLNVIQHSSNVIFATWFSYDDD